MLVMAAWVCATAAAQPPRTRTLVYDAEHKTWKEEAPPPPGTPDGDLHVIRELVKAKRYRQALSAVKKFSKKYGDSVEAWAGVMLAEAQARIGRRQFAKAHEILQSFLSKYGGSDLTVEALRLEHVVAEAFLSGVKRKFLGIRLLSGKELGYEILDTIAADYPDTRVAELAIKTKADHLFREGEFTLAEAEYARLVRSYPTTRYLRYAMRRAADAALASFGGVPYDGAALIEAQERFEEYRRRFPAEAAGEDVDLILQRIAALEAEKEYRIGRYYERTDHLSSAVFQYQRVQQEWPESVAAAKARKRLRLLGVAPASAEGGSRDGRDKVHAG